MRAIIVFVIIACASLARVEVKLSALFSDRMILKADAAVAVPIAVRHGWAANPMGNLIKAADLPASPIRTDD